MNGFKQFMLRGNVLDLAVAVVIGAAFAAVVTAFVKDLLTPLIAAIVGKPDFSAIGLTVNGSRVYLGGSFLLSQRIYPVPYAWGRLANLMVQTAVAFALLTQIEASRGFVANRIGIEALYATAPDEDGS